MKVAVVGLPFFAKKIAKNLSETDAHNSYVALVTGEGIFNKIAYFWRVLNANVLYQIGGSHVCGGTLRLALSLNKKIIMHWVGTDVLNLRKASKRGEVDAELLSKSIHLCEVDWIQRELDEVNVHASIAQIACFEKTIPLPVAFPSQFSILSYVGSGREKFYGIDSLIALALAFPDVEIRIAGISKYSEALPPNISLLGWVDNMQLAYQNCVLYLRLAEHDGLAFSVIEALANGRYVGYSNEFFFTRKIDNDKILLDYVEFLFSEFKVGKLKLNSSGYDFIMRCHSRDEVMGNLIKIICN